MNQQASNSSEFDYSTLDSEARIIVQQRASEIKSLMRQTVQNIVEIGEKLTQAKAELGHGNFTRWLKYEFEWQERSARNFMRVAEVFKTANFADLDFAASALYLLAAPSTPEVVRETALQLASQGETITYSKAKTLVENHKQTQQNTSTQILPELNSDETNAIKSPDDELVSVSSQTKQSPTVEISQLSEGEIQVTIDYIDVNLSITGREDRVIACLIQMMSNPNVTNKIVRQIESQIDSQVE